MEQIKHKHHIVPKHAGGSDDPSNIVELTIKEHAEAHRALYEEHGRWQDKIAWLGLSGQIGKEDARLEAIRAGIEKRDMSYFKSDEWKERVKGWMSGREISEKTRRKMSKPKSEEHAKKLREHLIKHNKRTRSDEEKKRLSDAVKSTRKKCPYCEFESIATHVTRHIKRVHSNG